MSVASFEGKFMYRVDYLVQESAGPNDTVTREMTDFYIADTPEDAIAALRESLAPVSAQVVAVAEAMAGENLKYKVPVLN